MDADGCVLLVHSFTCLDAQMLGGKILGFNVLFVDVSQLSKGQSILSVITI